MKKRLQSFKTMVRLAIDDFAKDGGKELFADKHCAPNDESLEIRLKNAMHIGNKVTGHHL